MPRYPWLLGSFALAAACAVPRGASAPPSPAELGSRLRVEIAGREIPSIVSADYWIYFVVRDPAGTAHAIKAHAPETSSADGLSLIAAHTIEVRAGIEDLELVESLHHDGEPSQVEDVRLPDGWHLSLEPGTFYVYRRTGDRMVAERDPEIRLLAIRRDGTGYAPAPPSLGPAIDVDAEPPEWPPGNR